MHQLVLTLLAMFSSGLSVAVPLPRPAHAKDSALFRARALIKRCNMETIYADRFVLGERFETNNHTPYLNQDLMTQIDRSDGSSCADGLGQLALEQVDYTLADQVLLAAVLLLGALRLAAVFRAAGEAARFCDLFAQGGDLGGELFDGGRDGGV